MKSRIKKKKREKMFTYKGQRIVINSFYTCDISCNVMLLYSPIEGVELYFKTVSRAKRYLDSVDRIPKIKDNIPF